MRRPWFTIGRGLLSDAFVVRTLVVPAIATLSSAPDSELASHGARVVLACRNVAAGREAAARMARKVDVVQLDVASLESVRAFAEQWDGSPTCSSTTPGSGRPHGGGPRPTASSCSTAPTTLATLH